MSDASDRTLTLTAFVGRPVQEVAALLVSRAPNVMPGAPQSDGHHVIVNLDVPLGNEGSVSRAASIELGIADRDERCRLPITISALERERWFPTFHGQLEAEDFGIGDTRLRLIGEYDLPFGAIGRATGRAGADKLARASLYSLFVSIVTAIELELKQNGSGFRPATAPELVRGRDDHPLGA